MFFLEVFGIQFQAIATFLGKQVKRLRLDSSLLCYGTDALITNYTTLLDLRKIKTITATEPQSHRTVFKYFAIFENVALNLEPSETPSMSESHQALNFVQRSKISQNMMK